MFVSSNRERRGCCWHQCWRTVAQARRLPCRTLISYGNHEEVRSQVHVEDVSHQVFRHEVVLASDEFVSLRQVLPRDQVAGHEDRRAPASHYRRGHAQDSRQQVCSGKAGGREAFECAGVLARVRTHARQEGRPEGKLPPKEAPDRGRAQRRPEGLCRSAPEWPAIARRQVELQSRP